MANRNKDLPRLFLYLSAENPNQKWAKNTKKHHKSDKKPEDVAVTRDLIAEPPLKLVLKVGNKTQDSKAGKFDICVSKPESKLPQVHHAIATSDDHAASKPESQKKKSKKKKRKWHEAQNSNSEQEREVVETESGQEDAPMEVEESEEDLHKQSFSILKKKLPKKQHYLAEESEKADIADQSSVTSDVTSQDQGPKSQAEAPYVREAMKGPLKKVLEFLQKTIQRKDVDQFFAWPVNDVIAPGYSSIIQHPMDFSTMKRKIDGFEYASIDDYKSDFLLMCENATIYNRPETIYYKAAKRLQSVGLKCMSKEKLSALKRTFGYHESGESKVKSKSGKRTPQADADVSTEDSSVMDVIESEDSNIPPSAEPVITANDIDEESPEEVIQQVLQAAQHARDRLTARRPDSKLGFLRRDKAGTTTLAILNPKQSGLEETKEVNLGMLTGRLAQGTGTLPGFREDKRNKVCPVTYMAHGPFNSYGPQYDSSFANISKEDSDLLYATYGDEAGVQYAQSIKDYVENCEDYVVKLVDNLLDSLTKGQHSKTIAVLQEKNGKPEMDSSANQTSDALDKQKGSTNSDQVLKADAEDVDLTPIQFDSLQSLSELGIDTSFLATFEKLFGEESEAASASAEIDSKLKSTSDLIGDLEKTQSARLSQKPPNHLQFIPKPSEQESSIAEKLTQQLLQLTSKIKPSDIVSTGAVHKAMGIVTPDIPTDFGEEVQELDSAMMTDESAIEDSQQSPVTR